MARTHPEFVMTRAGLRVPSPYIEQRGVGWWCLSCDCSLDNAAHLEKKTHRNKAWYWCFGCTDRGYEQRARAPFIDFDSREVTPKFWSNSPTEMQVDGAPGAQWATAAQQALPAPQEPAYVPAAAAAAAPGTPPYPPPGVEEPPLQRLRDRPDWVYEGHSDDATAILKEIETSRDEIAKEMATMKEQIATLSTELEDKIQQLAASIASISAILNHMYPRGAAGLRTLSGSASDPHFSVRTLGGGPYDQHREDGQSRT